MTDEFETEGEFDIWGILNKNDLCPNDPGWKIHREFYQQVSPYLEFGAQLLIAEVEPFETEVFIPTSEPIPYDIRLRKPIEDFKEMMAVGSLTYKETNRFVYYEEGAMYWLIIAEKPADT